MLSDANMKNIIMMVLDKLLDLNDETYTEKMREMYSELITLIESGDAEMRSLVRKHFARIGRVFHISDV